MVTYYHLIHPTGAEDVEWYVMSNKQLASLGREWQSRLRLQDWDILYSFDTYDEVEGDAKTSFNKQLKTARVRIVTEVTRPYRIHNADQPYDIEEILVHELLHLSFYMIEQGEYGTPHYCLMESGIDAVAWALVRAKRGGK